NPFVNTPLQLEVGKSSSLGLFAGRPTLSTDEFALTFWPEHTRSILVGRVIFSDNEGHLYRDIDLKGIGAINYRSITLPSFPNELGKQRDDGGRSGLLEEKIACLDCRMSEEFVNAGIRTYRVLAIIALDEIIHECKKISIEEANETAIFPKTFQPVISVRAFGTKARMLDIYSTQRRYAQFLLQDAQKLVSEETSNPALRSPEKYLEWFARTLGTNVGLMHRINVVHNLLTRHNITLDCRIVDLDSLSAFNSEGRNEDLGFALESLQRFAFDVTSLDPETTLGNTEELVAIFRKSYKESSSH
ncbi:MAG: hypothetical protein Q8Q92_02125, partial [bacterium]|nr:hypothetical protein [bacterium]